MVKKVILTVLFCLFSTISFAKQIDIITRFNATSATGRFVLEFVKELNKEQSEYNFRVVVVPGANGESADQKALLLSRSGTDVLLYAPSGTFTFNRYIVGNTYDREKDFIPIIGLATVPVSVLVARDSPITNIYDLLSTLHKKEKAFSTTTVNSVSVLMLEHIFKTHFNLKNVNSLAYNNLTDSVRSVINSEADFTIFNHVDASSLRPILFSSENRLPQYPNIPTGKEIGIQDFNFNSLSIFSAPKERSHLTENFFDLFMRVCKSEKMQEIISKTQYTPVCEGKEYVLEKIKKENVLVDKYKNIIVR